MNSSCVCNKFYIIKLKDLQDRIAKKTNLKVTIEIIVIYKF